VVSAPAALATPPPISQYVEQIPTASGPRPARQQQQQQQQHAQIPAQSPSSSAPGTSSTSATSTSKHGSAQQTTTRAPEQGAKQVRATPGALGAAFSSDDSGGLGRGVLLAIALSAVTALAIGAFVFRRR
jgi:hypothetical protein